LNNFWFFIIVSFFNEVELVKHSLNVDVVATISSNTRSPDKDMTRAESEILKKLKDKNVSLRFGKILKK
jgi:hypothetical protein